MGQQQCSSCGQPKAVEQWPKTDQNWAMHCIDDGHTVAYLIILTVLHAFVWFLMSSLTYTDSTSNNLQKIIGWCTAEKERGLLNDDTAPGYRRGSWRCRSKGHSGGVVSACQPSRSAWTIMTIVYLCDIAWLWLAWWHMITASLRDPNTSIGYLSFVLGWEVCAMNSFVGWQVALAINIFQ